MFNFTDTMTSLVRHITTNCPEFGHIDTERLIISYSRTRSPGMHGVYASLQPLRFEGGATSIQRRKRTYVMPSVIHHGREMFYIVYFAMPRFMNLDFETKVVTVFHELYHISPEFNGDIRRFPGKNYAHGHSRKRYNDRVRVLMESYLPTPGAEEQVAFLRMSMDELTERHGEIVGVRIRPPKPRLAS